MNGGGTSIGRTAATAERVLRQLRHDPRTVALLLLVPCVLLALLRGILGGGVAFQHAGPVLLAVFPFTTLFVVTSVATLRERTSGTLERLLALPLAKGELLGGYALAFSAVGLVQVLLAAALALGPLGLTTSLGAGALFGLAIADALLGMALGLLVSAFAASEFQAVQFLPAVVLPQVLLCGLFAPRATMATGLRWLSDALPLSYAVDALARPHGWDTTATVDLIVVVAAAAAALALAAATLRRRTS
jgi:ABC-2 type transport system permease protein